MLLVRSVQRIEGLCLVAHAGLDEGHGRGRHVFASGKGLQVRDRLGRFFSGAAEAQGVTQMSQDERAAF